MTDPFPADPTSSLSVDWLLLCPGGYCSCRKVQPGKASLLHVLCKMTTALGPSTGLVSPEMSFLPNANPKKYTSLLSPFSV